MDIPPIALVLFVTCLEIQLVYNQYWNGYCSDPYAYGYGQPYYTQPYTGYSDSCSQLGYHNQPSYYPYNDRDEDDSRELMDVINFISSLQNEPNGPIYISYPVPMSNCGSDYTEDGCLDCVCKTRECGCSKNCENYDTCESGCGCRNQEKSRSKCNSGKRSDTNCDCKNNVILHKIDCCCRC